MKLGGWGRYPLIETKLKSPSSIEELVKEISNKNLIARGNGRSYGDSAINKSNTICRRRATVDEIAAKPLFIIFF